MRLSPPVARHLAALRAMLVLTAVLGLAYPLLTVGVAKLPGLDSRTAELGRAYTAEIPRPLGGRAVPPGTPLPRYFQSRPSVGGYDPLASGASNLGPESVVDRPDAPSLLTQLCSRSLAVGELEGVSGARPYCTSDGVGAVLGVFRADGRTGAVTRVVSLNQPCPAAPFVSTYGGVRVECAEPGADDAGAVVTPVRGTAIAVVPPDAVTASGSGLDPDISTAYASLQVPRVARERGVPADRIADLVRRYTSGRTLGFMGEPGVDVVDLNRALDRQFPARS